MNDAENVMNRGKIQRFGDEEVVMYPLDFDDHGDIQAWLDGQVKNPMDLIRNELARGGLPMAVQQYMVKSAIEVWARTRILVGTVEAEEHLNTINGKAFQLYLSVKKGNPDFTLEMAMNLLRKEDQRVRDEAIARIQRMRPDAPK